jgi:hypothetical protein
VGLVKEVRLATQDFRNVRKAIDAGYESTGSCVSGPEKGAMGIHYANGALIGDGLIDAKAPELLIYEQKDGRLRLVGVEFLVLADAWNASHPNGEPPVLMGQHFHFVGTPNRYRLPAFYELHVWAWRDNPSGDFVDWNPDVSCSEFNLVAQATELNIGGQILFLARLSFFRDTGDAKRLTARVRVFCGESIQSRRCHQARTALQETRSDPQGSNHRLKNRSRQMYALRLSVKR